METHDVLAILAVLAGLIGVVLVLLPGIALQIVAVLLWAFEEGSATGWVILSIVVAIAALTTVLKYLRPGRRLKEAGIPNWLIALAAGVAVVGLFVIPIIGAPLGFVLAIYVFERRRAGATAAWPSTKRALSAIALSVGIELTGALVIAVVFIAGTAIT